ncbi:MAG: N-acetylglucosamine-6-phosphate deacetylase [Alphaproteobacteria bacterium]|nr:N-acetylglucosamine-6-phosphate deacetylase [Alphaproteobacteria bacterium]MBU2270064.1 N-acetylglucosamine-6-phosphate deacetylase [Alphaproteobacteria bacterium]MBU2417098.1 N-acetylglucosamine-6-phosphate deacetylase [Alphaproteobacteria bacterium]
MSITLTNGRVLTGEIFRTDVSVTIEGERITRVGPGPAPGGEVHDLGGAWLVPGFIDTQVNGGGGVLFNDCPTADCIDAIGQAHRQFGTTGFLPTLISDDLSVIDTAITAVETAIARGVPGVLGIHIEGPFLNESRKGVHDASKFRTLDDRAIALLTRLKSGRTLVTLAPETTTPAMITRLVQAGAVVAAGHTDADYVTTRAALDAGMTGFTHLFNAMSPLTSRAPGAVGAALEDINSWCGLIVDGHHVDPVVLKLALRCRPRNRFMLVTDAMPSVGSPEDHFMLQGRQISVRDGVCLDPDGVLAGSDLNMAAAVRNAHRLMDLHLPAAIALATTNPAEFLGLGDVRGRIEAGLAADLVVLDDDLTVVETWIGGVAS